MIELLHTDTPTKQIVITGWMLIIVISIFVCCAVTMEYFIHRCYVCILRY